MRSNRVWSYKGANYLLVYDEPTSLRGPITRVYRIVPREPKRIPLGSFQLTADETIDMIFGGKHA